MLPQFDNPALRLAVHTSSFRWRPEQRIQTRGDVSGKRGLLLKFALLTLLGISHGLLSGQGGSRELKWCSIHNAVEGSSCLAVFSQRGEQVAGLLEALGTRGYAVALCDDKGFIPRLARFLDRYNAKPAEGFLH